MHAVISNLTIRDGYAGIDSVTGQSGTGGGIQVDGDLTIRNSRVTSNSTRGYSGYVGGGGIGTRLSGSNVVVEGCTIDNNYADQYGGAILMNDGALTIRNSTISGNLSFPGHFIGSGVWARNSEVQIANSTLVGSSSDLWLESPSPGAVISSSTVGGLIVYVPSNLEVRNSSFVYHLLPVTSGGHNIVTHGTFHGSGGLVDGVNGDRVGTLANPLDSGLGPLQDNGGPTLTRAPLPGSLAIDSGNPLSTLLFDQRGVSRPQGAAHDIGAVEFSGQPNTFCNGDGGDQLGCTNCPCGNNSPAGTLGGCLNSAGSSAKLIAYGDASISLPAGSASDLGFSLTGAPPSVFAVLTSGDAVAPLGAANPCFGMQSGVQALAFDGLRCAALNTRRHGGRATTSDGTVSVLSGAWGGAGNPQVGIAALVGFNSGQTRFFQAIHRDDALLSCMRGLNTSQSVRVIFEP